MQKITCLIVEDEINDRELLEKCLHFFHERLTVLPTKPTTVNDAVEAILAHSPDVVFADIRLQGGDYFDVLEVLKKQNVVVASVLFTAYRSDMAEYAQKYTNNYTEYIKAITYKPIAHNWKEEYAAFLDKIAQEKPKKDVQNQFIKISDLKLRIDDIYYIATNDTKKNSLTFYVLPNTLPNTVRQKNAAQGIVTLNATLTEWLKVHTNEQFIRISRDRAINSDKIVSVISKPETEGGGFTVVFGYKNNRGENSSFPVSRNFVAEIKAFLKGKGVGLTKKIEFGDDQNG